MTIAFQGYQGLVDGGDNIKLAHWHSVTNIIQLVGLKYCRQSLLTGVVTRMGLFFVILGKSRVC